MLIALELNYGDLEIAFNSLAILNKEIEIDVAVAVVSLINSESNANIMMPTLISNCRTVIARLEQKTMKHIFREDNR